MSRFVPFVLACLLATACGAVGNPGVAASVNDTEISVAEVTRAFESASGQPGFTEQVAQQGRVVAERATTSNILGRLITAELLTQAGVDLGLEAPGDEEVTAELDAILTENFGGDEDAFADALAQEGLTEAELREQVRLGLTSQAIQAAVAENVEVSEDDLRQAYAQQYPQGVSHILVETEAEAQEVLDRLDAGESFADLATELSLDQASAVNGGALGPIQPGTTVPEFEEAALALQAGEVSDPVETQFGWHVLTLTDQPTFEEVRDDLVGPATDLATNAALEDFFNSLLFDADIVVNPRFGTWDSLSQTVQFSDPLGELTAAPGTTPEVPAGDAGLPLPPPSG